MNEKKHILYNTKQVRSFQVNTHYSSRMLLDDTMVGGRTVQINEGTVAPGASLGGDTHLEDEIYYILEGEGEIRLGEETKTIKAGYLVFIPAGTHHALINTSSGKPMVLLTLWREPYDNDVYNARLKAWGTSFVLEE